MTHSASQHSVPTPNGDPNTAPTQDFFRYVNGAWLDTFEIPADRAGDGVTRELLDLSEEAVKTIITSLSDKLSAPENDENAQVTGPAAPAQGDVDAQAGDTSAAAESAFQDSGDAAAAGVIAEHSADAQKVAGMYASFMDVDRLNAAGIDPIRGELEAIQKAENHSELARVAGELYRAGVGGPFDAYVSADAKNSDRYALYLVQSGISLPDESYYREEQYAEVRSAFRAHVTAMSRLAGLGEYTGLGDEQLGDLVLDLETRFAAHHWDRVRNRDAEKTYNTQTLAELSETATGFDTRAWLTGTGAPLGSEIAGSAESSAAESPAAAGAADSGASGTSGAGDTSGADDTAPDAADPGSKAFTLERVIVGQPSAFTGEAQVWAETPLESLKAWMMFEVLTSTAPFLTEALTLENFNFYGTILSGTQTIRERWKRGVSTVEQHLGEIVGKLYVAEHFPASSKAAISELVDKLIEAYRESITTLDWMGEDTKRRALEKLDLFTPKVGYPDEWRAYEFEIRADDLVGNVRRASVAETDRQLGRLGQEIDRGEWLMTPQMVNAYFHPVMNEIVFPAAILQPPFFDPQASDATNFGAIGAVIGHEIGHGFDDQGSRYDGHGNLNDWWTQADRERFTARTQALVEQFDVLVPAGLDESETVNGSLTIGENIGDLGGLGIAWKALGLTCKEAGRQVSQTDAEEFFVSWATVWRAKFRPEERRRRLKVDPHSPKEFRCNQIVKNLDAFHATFGTQPGDPMWLAPAERVTIW